MRRAIASLEISGRVVRAACVAREGRLPRDLLGGVLDPGAGDAGASPVSLRLVILPPRDCSRDVGLSLTSPQRRATDMHRLSEGSKPGAEQPLPYEWRV